MALKFLLYALTLFALDTHAFSNNSYFITAPKTFRPGMIVNMNVLILRTQPPGAPVTINATFIIGLNQIAASTGQFHAGQMGLLKLHIPTEGFPESSDGFRQTTQHVLQVSGSGGLTFNQRTSHSVEFVKKGFTIYIQTDKGIYKPGQTGKFNVERRNVHMRFIAVYSSLKVHKGKMSITISDPKNNKLALWKDVSSASGVVSKDFELSSQPNMGDWKISVDSEGHTKEATFEVKEYVLPKFEVKIVTNSFASKGNGDIRGSVTAKYTYGKNVGGKAKLAVHFSCSSYQTCEKYELSFDIDGSHSFAISKERIIKLYPHSWGDPYGSYYGYQVVLNASVTEKLTQKTYHGETTVKLYRSAVVLKYAESNPKTFKAGFPFQALIEVTRPDGSAVPDTLVTISSTTYPGGQQLSKTYTSDANGYVVFQRNIEENISNLNINAKTKDEFDEEVTFYKHVSKFESESKTYLTVTADEYEVEVGKEIVCNIKCTEKFSSLNYILLSRGNTVNSSTARQDTSVNAAGLKFMATSIMSPSAKIVVYFVRNDGEIVADSVTIKVNGAFENDVSVKFSRTQAGPGEAVNVNVKASPFSQVGLLAVDKSVLLLDKGNDFSVSQVMEELGSYGGDSSNSFPPWWRWRRRRSFFPWYATASNSLEIFQGVNLAVITDCKGRLVTFRGHRLWSFFTTKTEMSSDDELRTEYKRKEGRQLAEVTTVRTLFPETWLWKTVNTDSSGHVEVRSKSPDTITSWVLSAFAVSNETGFGVANEKPQLRVFQPFFLSMDLPYSVIRGEEVAIKVIVFNYESEDMKVTVTLKGSNDWKNLERKNESSTTDDNAADDTNHVINVSADSGATVSFPIVPSKLGNIPIEVHAQSTTSADAVKRTLLVEPEGIEQEYSYSLLVDLNSTTTFNRELILALPSDVVKGSAMATVSVIGDIMGSSISGFDNLLKMPYGCGEQNMINFAPSMFIRTYLETVDQLTQSIKEKSVKIMTSGYQRELSYQHHDGSYSAFGEQGGVRRSGSLWLTAFVVKSFSSAKSYIYIDPASLSKSVSFILKNQQRDGSFAETGHVSSYLQGGLKSSSPEALTAYVLVSLLESGDETDDVKQGILKAVSFLKGKLREMDDTYTLALIAYAFELADDPAKETALAELMKKVVREDGTLHWEESSSGKSESSPWLRPYYRPRSADIEITSYVLLAYAHKKDIQIGLPIAQWLAQQRNSLGGYSSTQDTVIGLQALSQFAPLVFSSDVSFTLNVKLSAKASYDKTFQVNRNNLVVLQEEELPTVDGNVVISAQGKGFGVLQIGVTYNVEKAPTENSFVLVVHVKNADSNQVEARSCMKYTGDGDKSGMAILEFGLPSGFSLDQEDLNKLLSDDSNNVKRVERPGRKVVLYFDEVPKSSELCVDIKSVRTHAVGKAQPIPVVVYDYYKPEKRATTMYATQDDVSLCDVCVDCASCLPQTLGTGHATRVVSFSHVLMAIITLFLYHIQ